MNVDVNMPHIQFTNVIKIKILSVRKCFFSVKKSIIQLRIHLSWIQYFKESETIS